MRQHVVRNVRRDMTTLNTIKWSRLVRICERITGRTITISLTTIFTEVRAGVSFNDLSADIVLNGSLCKTDEDVIEALAHEIAHIMDGNTHHDNEFPNRMGAVSTQLRKEYYSI